MCDVEGFVHKLHNGYASEYTLSAVCVKSTPCYRYEAEQLPTTVTSHIDPRKFDAQRTDYVPVHEDDSMSAAECMPSMQWVQEFLADFAALRAQLHK